MGAKEKIKQYIDYKGITVYQFEKETELSNGILKSGSNFTTDKLKQIRDTYPDLNMNWLVYNEGNMLLTGANEVNEPQKTYQKEAGTIELLKKDVENLEKLLESKNETIAVLKHQLGINNGGNSQSKAS